MAESRRTSPTSRRLGEIAILGVSIIAVFAVLIWLVGIEGVADTPENAGSSLSNGRRGTLALYKWLEGAGFEVSRVESGERFPPDVDTLIMVNPNGDFPEGQAASVKRWVEEGNTLILAIGQRSADLSAELGGAHPMMRELKADLQFSPGYTPTVQMSQPLFSRPPVSAARVPGVFSLEAPLKDTVVLASSRDEDGRRLPLVAMLKQGEGRVFLLSSDYPLSNLGIRDEDNGALIYNMAQMAGGRRVAFDEAHHGAAVGGDLIGLLTSTPWGWALIYGSLLLGAYYFWSARRLGPPIPERTPDQRRPTSEYVTSVAGLFRRARKPGYAAERYLRFFKRTLSRHAELDPYLTDVQFVQSLHERGRHAFNPDEMLRAIQLLRQLEGNASASDSVELETLKAIREAEKVRRQALGLTGESS